MLANRTTSFVSEVACAVDVFGSRSLGLALVAIAPTTAAFLMKERRLLVGGTNGDGILQYLECLICTIQAARTVQRMLTQHVRAGLSEQVGNLLGRIA